MNHPIIILLNALEDIMGFIVTAWIYLAQCAIIVLILVAVIPNSLLDLIFGFTISWLAFAQGLWDIVVKAPSVFIFEVFGDAIRHFRAAMGVDDIGGLEAFVNFLAMIGSILLLFGLELAFWLTHIMLGFVALSGFIITPELLDRAIATEKRNDNVGIFDRNDFYQSIGRTTRQEIYDADVKATSIANALKR